MEQGILNRSYKFLSAGTRLEILVDSNKPWKKRGDVISSGYITVRLRTNPSHRMLDQQRNVGTFDIEKEYVTPLRPREDSYTGPLRSERRKAKHESVKSMAGN